MIAHKDAGRISCLTGTCVTRIPGASWPQFARGLISAKCLNGAVELWVQFFGPLRQASRCPDREGSPNGRAGSGRAGRSGPVSERVGGDRALDREPLRLGERLDVGRGPAEARPGARRAYAAEGRDRLV